jgi:hypothetical protein
MDERRDLVQGGASQGGRGAIRELPCGGNHTGSDQDTRACPKARQEDGVRLASPPGVDRGNPRGRGDHRLGAHHRSRAGRRTSGKIGPAEYRAGSLPGARATVYDEAGRYLSGGCYPTWVLKRGTTVIKSSREESCSGSFSFGSDSLKVRGLYHLTVSVITDAGPKGTSTADFTVT